MTVFVPHTGGEFNTPVAPNLSHMFFYLCTSTVLCMNLKTAEYVDARIQEDSELIKYRNQTPPLNIFKGGV